MDLSNLGGSRYFLENMTDNVWILDLETLTFKFQNQAIKKLTGYTPEEAMARPLEVTLTPSSLGSISGVIFDSLDRLKTGAADTILVETELYKKDGSTIWLESSLYFYQEEDKRYALGISRDISRRRKAEDEREKLLAKLKETLAEKERLLKENKILRGLLPICSNCNKIRDEDGNWHELEDYIEARSQARFTHTICPNCAKLLYPEIYKED